MFKLNNLQWILIGIISLIFVFEINNKKENLKIKTETEKINQVEIKIPTETIKSDFVLVKRIIDGDTLIVIINEKEEAVRLIGVDTPETVDPRKKVQCFGKEASEKMKELAENKMLRLESDITQNDRDNYNRLLRYVYLEDGTLINKILIEEGFAFEYTYQIPYKFQNEFKESQKKAESEKKGMWASGVCPDITVKITPTLIILTPTKIVKNNTVFICDCNKVCNKISSCEEAYFQLNECGCTIIDNDGDGAPCESFCN